MKIKSQEMVASCIKEARLAKGFTQKELSDLTNISVRSIQRIESGEIVPRSFTIKTLASALDVSLDQEKIPDAISRPNPATGMTMGQKIIITIGLPLVTLCACWAFIAQSATFPESMFELMTMAAIMVLIISTALYFIWKRN